MRLVPPNPAHNVSSLRGIEGSKFSPLAGRREEALREQGSSLPKRSHHLPTEVLIQGWPWEKSIMASDQRERPPAPLLPAASQLSDLQFEVADQIDQRQWMPGTRTPASRAPPMALTAVKLLIFQPWHPVKGLQQERRRPLAHFFQSISIFQ